MEEEEEAAVTWAGVKDKKGFWNTVHCTPPLAVILLQHREVGGGGRDPVAVSDRDSVRVSRGRRRRRGVEVEETVRKGQKKN